MSCLRCCPESEVRRMFHHLTPALSWEKREQDTRTLGAQHGAGESSAIPLLRALRPQRGDSLSQDQFRMPGLDHPADAVVPIYLCWFNQLAHPRQVHRYTGKGLVGIEELGFFPDQLTEVGAPLFDAERVTAPVG